MPAPTVTTAAASEVKAHKATLNGTVDPGGLPTTYDFEYFRDDWQAAGLASRTNLFPDPLAKAAWERFGSNGELSAVEVPGPAGTGIVTASEFETSQPGTGTGLEVALTAGVTYRFSIYIEVLELTEAAKVVGRVYNSEGTNVADSAATAIEAPGSWVRVDFSYTPSASGSYWFGAVERNSGTAHFRATGALVEAASELGAYFPLPRDLESTRARYTGTELESPIEYLTDVSYTPASKEGDAGEGEAAVEVSEEATGLEPETAYHARLYASNEDGEAWGGDVELTTLAGGGNLGGPGRPLSCRNRIVNP